MVTLHSTLFVSPPTLYSHLPTSSIFGDRLGGIGRMNSSSPSSKEDGYDFPFQFMLDARSSPMNWDSPPKSGSTGILAPFQWSPPDSSSRPQKFEGDITGFYNGLNTFKDDDSFSFFDQSFFFMDEYQSGPLTSPLPTIPRDSQHRVSFSSRLTKCHRQRMSTIAEYPVDEDDSSTEEEEDDSSHEAESAIATQPEWDFRTEQSQKSSFKKLLDYVVPYPARRVKGKLAKQSKRKSSFAIELPRSSSIKTTDSSSTNTSDSSSVDEDWVAHGFFEIWKDAAA